MGFEQYFFGFEISYVNQPDTTFYTQVTKEGINNISACLIDDITTRVSFKK